LLISKSLLLDMIQVELTLQVQPVLADEALTHETLINETLTKSKDTPPAEITEQQWQQWFEQWLNHLAPQLSILNAYEVSLLLTTDAEIQQLNVTYRHQNSPTDVLAFAALEHDGPISPSQAQLPLNLGDIVISVETALRQAENHSLLVELAWLAAHGLLHLLGWDHPDHLHLDQMLSQQAQLMALVGLEAPVWSSEELGYV
jgi:probable rRNA maturation factor